MLCFRPGIAATRTADDELTADKTNDLYVRNGSSSAIEPYRELINSNASQSGPLLPVR